MTDFSVLHVKLHGEVIASLAHLPGDRTVLTFEDGYADDPARATLGLGLKDELGSLITDWPARQKRLLPWFSNLLPEGHLRSYLARRAGVNPEREFFLLAALGRDLPGALTVEPADGGSWPLETGAGPDERADEERRANALRFSLAGVQLKFSAIRNENENKGLTIPVSGVGGSWIVKLPSARFEGVPENEYAMLNLARAVGIDVPEIALIDVDAIEGLPEGIGDLKGQAFAIKRFDRTPKGPVHMEDFAQVFGVYPEKKYDKASYRNIMSVLAIEVGEAGVEKFIRRLTFCVLTGNADMHLKNWSLIYPDRRTPALSPAYDFVSTIPYLADEEAALKFGRKNRFSDFTLDELSYIAGKAGVPETPVLRTAKQTAEDFLEVWDKEKHHLPQDRRVTEAIDRHLTTLPLVRKA